MRRSRVLRSKRMKSGRVRRSRKNLSSKRKNNRKRKSRKMSKMKLSKSVKMRNRRSTQRLRKTRRNSKNRKNRKNRKKRGGTPITPAEGDERVILKFTRNYFNDYMNTNIGPEDDITDISVSLDATEERLLTFFNKLDQDHDRAIDLREFLRFGVSKRDTLEKRLAVSKKEAEAIFSMIDKDDNGVISLKELALFLHMDIAVQFWTLNTVNGYLSCERILGRELGPRGRFSLDSQNLNNAADWMRAYAMSADKVLLTGSIIQEYDISTGLRLPKLVECKNDSDIHFLDNNGFIVHTVTVTVNDTDGPIDVQYLEIPHDMIDEFHNKKVIDILAPEVALPSESSSEPSSESSSMSGSSDTERGYNEMNSLLRDATELTRTDSQRSAPSIVPA